MGYQILHNGKNIRGEIDPAECFSCDRYGGMLDDLTIMLSSESCPVTFNEGDTLEVKVQGGFSTGEMYLDSCEGEHGRFTLRAISCRHNNRRRKSRIWNRVKLSKIINDVAADTGLTPLLYGVEDFTYASVAQIMEPDLQMLARLCKREGYSIKCDNGNLIVFNEYFLEHNSSPVTIHREDVGSGYKFSRSTNGLSRMTVRHFDPETMRTISHTATDENVPGGEDIRIEYVKDTQEAHRASVGYLRDANKLFISGALKTAQNAAVAAGTVCDLTGFEEFDGRYVAYEVTHDFVREQTAIKVRKVLDY